MAKAKKRAGRKKPAAKKKSLSRKPAMKRKAAAKPAPAMARPAIIPGAWPFPMPAKT